MKKFLKSIVKFLKSIKWSTWTTKDYKGNRYYGFKGKKEF